MTDRKREIQAEAEALLAKYGFLAPPIDPEFIAEGENVDVVFVDFDPENADKVHGFFDSHETRIYVNRIDSVPEKMFTIAHELGHMILHKDYLKDVRYVPRLKVAHHENVEEREADIFATFLIAPKKMVEIYSRMATTGGMETLFVATSETLKRAMEN